MWANKQAATLKESYCGQLREPDIIERASHKLIKRFRDYASHGNKLITWKYIWAHYSDWRLILFSDFYLSCWLFYRVAGMSLKQFHYLYCTLCLWLKVEDSRNFFPVLDPVNFKVSQSVSQIRVAFAAVETVHHCERSRTRENVLVKECQCRKRCD